MRSRLAFRRTFSPIELLEPRRLLSDTVIQGVLPVSLDQPQIHALVRRTLTSDPLAADDGFGGIVFDITAYFDSGTSGILLSQETATGLGIASEVQGGVPVTYYDVGVAGDEAFGVSEPLYVSLAPFTPDADVGNPDTWQSVYTQTTGPVRTEISLQPADELVGPLDIMGMPLFAGKVVVMDARPIAELSNMQTYVYDPGTPFRPATETTDPGIPNVGHHIKLSYASFDRFTYLDPATAAGPTTVGNPFIGPDPVKRLDNPNYNDGTPPVTIGFGGRTTTGSFLVDTGSAASFISQSCAAAVGVHYQAGTYGSDDPVLVDGNGVVIPNQFTLAVGGIGGSINAAGFYLDQMVLKTQEGDNIVFEGAPVLVVDVNVEDATTGQTMTLDGDIGMNYWVPSAEVVDGWPVNIAGGAFDWITLDQSKGVLGLADATSTVAAPDITGISTDTGTPGDGITSDRTLLISGAADPMETITLYRDGGEIGTTTSDFFGDWSYDYTHTSLADGTYNFTATATDLLGAVSNPSAPFKVTVDGIAPTVSSFKVNDGNAQRSMVKTMTVTFSEPVTLTNALQLTSTKGAALAGISLSISNPLGDSKTYVVSFSGSATTGGSLPDGLYKITVNRAGVSDLAGNVMAANQSNRFHRLYGDVDGDRDVDRADLAAFRKALNRSANYVWWLDYTGNGTIDNSDYLQLRKRLIKPLLK